MKISRELAQKFLSDVPEQNNFWVNNGPILKNLCELADFLRDVDDATYEYHVNKEKNDFSSWILQIIGDEKLAKDIFKNRNKESTYRKIQARIELLTKLANY